jgi:hypothetical protein
MANVMNVGELNLGSALRRLLNEYNMKPVLTRPQHRFFTDHKTYFEIDVDVHSFGYLARKGLSMLWCVCVCVCVRVVWCGVCVCVCVRLV